jgi:hypothetical protein
MEMTKLLVAAPSSIGEALSLGVEAERAEMRPLTLRDQKILHAVKLQAYHTLAALAERAIELLDTLDGDPDEGDPFNEDEPAFDFESREMVNAYSTGPGDPLTGDAEPHEDFEEDDGGGDCTEDEPGFDRRSRRIANAFGDGAGCVINGDREYNGDEGDHSR